MMEDTMFGSLLSSPIPAPPTSPLMTVIGPPTSVADGQTTTYRVPLDTIVQRTSSLMSPIGPLTHVIGRGTDDPLLRLQRERDDARALALRAVENCDEALRLRDEALKARDSADFPGGFGDAPFHLALNNPASEEVLKQAMRAALKQRDEALKERDAVLAEFLAVIQGKQGRVPSMKTCVSDPAITQRYVNGEDDPQPDPRPAPKTDVDRVIDQLDKRLVPEPDRYRLRRHLDKAEEPDRSRAGQDRALGGAIGRKPTAYGLRMP